MLPYAAIQPGTPAPDFTLPAMAGDEVSLADFRGRPVVLVFFPTAWSRVCGDQLTFYDEILPDFQRLGATVLGISVDAAWCSAAFAAVRTPRFPLLVDFEPKGAVARRYGVFSRADGTAQRALFVIDAEGTVQWSHVAPPSVDPGAVGILAALESMIADAPTPYGVIT